MLAHKIVLAAPGTGTIASLQREAGADNSIYINLPHYRDLYPRAEFLSVLKSAAAMATKGDAVTLIFDGARGVPEATLETVKTWTLEHKKLPITCHWVIPVLERATVNDSLESLLPLVKL